MQSFSQTFYFLSALTSLQIFYTQSLLAHDKRAFLSLLLIELVCLVILVETAPFRSLIKALKCSSFSANQPRWKRVFWVKCPFSFIHDNNKLGITDCITVRTFKIIKYFGAKGVTYIRSSQHTTIKPGKTFTMVDMTFSMLVGVWFYTWLLEDHYKQTAW